MSNAQKRNRLRIPFRYLPKWMLLASLFLVGLPVHILVGMFFGAREGCEAWSEELQMIRDLDK